MATISAMCNFAPDDQWSLKKVQTLFDTLHAPLAERGSNARTMTALNAAGCAFRIRYDAWLATKRKRGKCTHMHFALHLRNNVPQEIKFPLSSNGPGRWGHIVTISTKGLSNDRCTDRRVQGVGTSGADGDGASLGHCSVAPARSLG